MTPCTMVYGYQSFVENFCRLKALGYPETCVSIYRSSRSHSPEVSNTNITARLPPNLCVNVCLCTLQSCVCLIKSTTLVLEGSSNYVNALRTTVMTNYTRGIKKAEDGCERRFKGLGMAFPPFLVKQLYRCDSFVISSFVRTGYTTRR